MVCGEAWEESGKGCSIGKSLLTYHLPHPWDLPSPCQTGPDPANHSWLVLLAFTSLRSLTEVSQGREKSRRIGVRWWLCRGVLAGWGVLSPHVTTSTPRQITPPPQQNNSPIFFAPLPTPKCFLGSQHL